MIPDLTPEAPRSLSDPNYLPVQGQLWGYTNYLHEWSKGTNNKASGPEISSFATNANDFNQFVGYGITDDLMVDASIAYEPGATRDVQFAKGTTQSLSSWGFSDPTFGATWRILDQTASPVTFDVFGSYMPDWISSKIATTTTGGNFASGGQEGEIGAALAEETRFMTVRGSFTTQFLGRRQIDDAATGDIFDQGGHTNYVLALATQTRLSDQLSVNAGVTHTFTSNSSYTNTANSLSHTIQPGDDTVLDLALNYQFIPNTLVGSVIYRHGITGNTSNIYPDPVSDTITQDQYRNLLGVQIDYALP